MKHFIHKNIGTCSQKVEFDLDDNGKIFNIVFHNGCNGNLKAISKLCEGKDAKEIASILIGNYCGGRPTSCADQLAKAILDAIQLKTQV